MATGSHARAEKESDKQRMMLVKDRLKHHSNNQELDRVSVPVSGKENGIIGSGAIMDGSIPK